MKRRSFIKTLGALAAVAAVPSVPVAAIPSVPVAAPIVPKKVKPFGKGDLKRAVPECWAREGLKILLEEYELGQTKIFRDFDSGNGGGRGSDRVRTNKPIKLSYTDGRTNVDGRERVQS